MNTNTSAIEITFTVRIPPTRPFAFHATLAVHRAVRALSVWRRRARQRRDLLKLDARLLKDIGVSPSARAVECAKPSWRA